MTIRARQEPRFRWQRDDSRFGGAVVIISRGSHKRVKVQNVFLGKPDVTALRLPSVDVYASLSNGMISSTTSQTLSAAVFFALSLAPKILKMLQQLLARTSTHQKTLA